VRERIAAALAVEPDEYARALEWRAALRGAFGRLLERYDVLATPAVVARRKRIGSDTLATQGGEASTRAGLSRFTALVNHASVPAIVLPLASPGAPPPAIQLIGPPWSEARLLALGAALERAGISGFRPPPAGDDLPIR
jgi:Asp-tRNA(Asn)/Glu-tRNA(Gln) amidotransferase A subunit family amidase